MNRALDVSKDSKTGVKKQTIRRSSAGLCPFAGSMPAAAELEVRLREETLPACLASLATHQLATDRASGCACTEPDTRGEPRIQVGVLRSEAGAPDGKEDHDLGR